MNTVNQTNYVPKTGRKTKGPSLTQLAEYQPLGKMLNNLTIAGLNASARQALEYYDGNIDQEIDIPLLPRHISPDPVSVYEAAQFFQGQKNKIEERVRQEHEKRVQEQIAENDRKVAQAKAKAGGSPPA